MDDDQERTVTTVRQVGEFTITHERTYGPALPAPEPWVSKPRPDFAQAMRRFLEVHRRQNPRLHLSGPPAEPMDIRPEVALS